MKILACSWEQSPIRPDEVRSSHHRAYAGGSRPYSAPCRRSGTGAGRPRVGGRAGRRRIATDVATFPAGRKLIWAAVWFPCPGASPAPAPKPQSRGCRGSCRISGNFARSRARGWPFPAEPSKTFYYLCPAARLGRRQGRFWQISAKLFRISGKLDACSPVGVMLPFLAELILDRGNR